MALTLDLNIPAPFDECLVRSSIDLEKEEAEYAFMFPNGYGVIVRKGKFTKGYSLDRWEIEPMMMENGEEWYPSPDYFEDKTLARSHGSLTDAQVVGYLERYKNL